MSTSTEPESPSRRSEILRLGRWLSSPRGLRITLSILVSLITLVCLCYVLIYWMGKRAWTKLERELAAAGESVDLAAFVPPPVPDDRNFAMTPFLAPLFDFKPGTQQWRDPSAVKRAQDLGKELPQVGHGQDRWTLGKATDLGLWAGHLDPAVDTNELTASAGVVLEHLRPYEPVLSELRVASRRPQARFNILYDCEIPLQILLPHLQVIKDVIRILAIQASAELALGQSESAFQDILLGLQVMDSVKEEPVIISYLVRCAGLNLLTQPLWEGLAQHRWSEAQLQTLQARLEQDDFWTDCGRVMRAERAYGNANIECLRDQPGLFLEFEGVSSDATGAGGQEAGKRPWWPEFWFNRIPRGWFYLEQVQFVRLFQQAILSAAEEAARNIDPEVVQGRMIQMERETDHRNPWRIMLKQRLFASLLIPALPKVYQKAAYAQVVVDQVALACALERYRLTHNGAYPESLGALVPDFLPAVPADMIKGGPLHYHRNPDGSFRLYSIGWNGEDDGGQPGRNDRGNWVMDRGDWVWQYP